MPETTSGSRKKSAIDLSPRATRPGATTTSSGTIRYRPWHLNSGGEGRMFYSFARVNGIGPEGCMGAQRDSPRTRWSRRGFLVRGLISIAVLPALVRANGRVTRARVTSTARHSGRAATAPSGSGAVPSQSSAGGRLTTEVLINGVGPFHFMIDTGAERTVIAADIAQRLRLPIGAKALLEGIVRSVPTETVHIQQLTLGSLETLGLDVPILPRPMLMVDGILGLDVLNGRRVIFDFATHTLTVTGSEGFLAALWTAFDGVRVPTLGESGRLRATDCRIDGVHAAAFIDTGAAFTVSNEALFAACQKQQPTLPIIGLVSLSGVTGGTATGRVTVIDRLQLGELILTNTPVVIADLAIFRLWGLSHHPALLMGMNCLRAFKWVSIDYGRKTLQFKFAGTASPSHSPVLQPIM
jgi:predicted aspartyl protease